MNSTDAGDRVLIVGGGLVGASLALALSQAGVGSTLVEARSGAQPLADPDRERFLALARGSTNALSALKVWSGLAPHAESIAAVHVSRRGDFGRLLLRAREYQVDRFGAVVPASRLGAALDSALEGAPLVTRLAPATVRSFRVDASGVDVVVNGSDGECDVRATLLVGADGVDSFVRTTAGLPVERETYGQDALVLSVAITRDHHGVAYERFTDNGAIALLPLPGRRAGLVWTLPQARAADIEALPVNARLAVLQDEFGDRLGRFHAPGRLVRYPLARSFAPTLVTDRIALVGNAAQTLHPVAAQGFNLGLRDALVLAEEIAGVRSLQDAEKVSNALQRHAQRRASDRQRIASLSHGLARWPKLAVPGLSIARGAAMAALNAGSVPRESLVLAAIGFGADGPRLVLEDVA